MLRFIDRLLTKKLLLDTGAVFIYVNGDSLQVLSFCISKKGKLTNREVIYREYQTSTFKISDMLDNQSSETPFIRIFFGPQCSSYSIIPIENIPTNKAHQQAFYRWQYEKYFLKAASNSAKLHGVKVRDNFEVILCASYSDSAQALTAVFSEREELVLDAVLPWQYLFQFAPLAITGKPSNLFILVVLVESQWVVTTICDGVIVYTVDRPYAGDLQCDLADVKLEVNRQYNHFYKDLGMTELNQVYLLSDHSDYLRCLVNQLQEIKKVESGGYDLISSDSTNVSTSVIMCLLNASLEEQL